MQNTAVNIRLSPAAGLFGRRASPPYDLMIPRKDEAILPVIFLNREVPEILPRILREYEQLTSEARLCGRLYGTSRSRCPAPLVSWYGSVLGNVYAAGSAVRRNQTYESFALSCVLFTPEENSEYYYAALDLPPLWRRPVNGGTGSMKNPLITAGRDRHAKTARLIFRRSTETGLWYAVVSVKSRMKNVFSQYIRA